MNRVVCAIALLIIVAPAQGAIEKTTRAGPVEAIASLTPEQPVIGDAVTLTLTVTAEADVELIMPQFGQMLERFTILDFTTDENLDAEGRTVITQTYELEPASSGQQAAPPIMIEFVDRRPDHDPAPEGADAYELLTERIEFEVQSVLPTDAKADLHPPLGELDPLPVETSRSWAWIIIAIAVIVAAPFVYRLWAASRKRSRQRSAYDIAAGRLGALLQKPRQSADEIDAFFVELSAIVRWYLETRFDLRAPELTTEEFLDLMARSPDMTREHQALLRDFLSRADLVKFANFVPGEQDIDRSIAAARRFLDETRHHEPNRAPAAAGLEAAHA